MATDEPFFSRWSRLKQDSTSQKESKEEEALDSGSDDADLHESQLYKADLHKSIETEQAQHETKLAGTESNISVVDIDGDLRDESEAAEEEPDLPSMNDVDALNEGDSASSFLLPGVASEVKKAALRKLFRSESYNLVDGLNDYDLDYSKTPSLAADVVAGLRNWLKESPEDDTAILNSQEGITDSDDIGTPACHQHNRADDEPDQDAVPSPENTTNEEISSVDEAQPDATSDKLSHALRQNVAASEGTHSPDGS